MDHSKAPRVFISYSHESAEHNERVLNLANKLRQQGVDAWIDRYTPHPSMGWARWMQTEIEKAEEIATALGKRVMFNALIGSTTAQRSNNLLRFLNELGLLTLLVDESNSITTKEKHGGSNYYSNYSCPGCWGDCRDN